MQSKSMISTTITRNDLLLRICLVVFAIVVSMHMSIFALMILDRTNPSTMLSIPFDSYVSLLVGQSEMTLLLVAGCLVAIFLAKNFRSFLGMLLSFSLAHIVMASFFLLVRGNGGLGGL